MFKVRLPLVFCGEDWAEREAERFNFALGDICCFFIVEYSVWCWPIQNVLKCVMTFLLGCLKVVLCVTTLISTTRYPLSFLHLGGWGMYSSSSKSSASMGAA